MQRKLRTGFGNAGCYIIFARTCVRAFKAVLASLRSATPHSQSDTRRVVKLKRHGDAPQSKRCGLSRGIQDIQPAPLTEPYMRISLIRLLRYIHTFGVPSSSRVRLLPRRVPFRVVGLNLPVQDSHLHGLYELCLAHDVSHRFEITTRLVSLPDSTIPHLFLVQSITELCSELHV